MHFWQVFFYKGLLNKTNLTCEILIENVQKRKEKNRKGALGVEPRTYRSAVDCSTTELYTLT